VSHADEVITDVQRRRVMARAHEDSFTIAWDYPGRTLLEVRILRSSEGPTEAPDDGPDQGQELVYQDVNGSFRDASLRPDRRYFYSVFARHPGGEWVRWEEYALHGGGMRKRRPPVGASRGRRDVPWARLVALSVALAVLLIVPAVSRASGATGGKTTAASAGAAAASAAAQADPSVAAILEGTGAAVEQATPWGGSGGRPAGYRLEYRWSAAAAKVVNEVVPLLRAKAATPEAPYASADYRVRASDVSGLQVDVLLDGPQVIQVLPVAGQTELVLHEQTWPPFSWLPWFTSRPWVIAPVFVVLAILFMVRAWLRSRAWNRRLPSMTRHDRQFIARVAVLLFLLAGFVWQFYEGWYAATGPSVDSGATSAGSLASLPLLLIPPGLFIAGLILELSPAPRRGSWALLAILSGAASAYFLAAAVTGATTNLNITYYVLLAVLALIAIPRAFSAGKTGWSRGAAPRYG
jgi:hypothetical protein